MMDRSGFLGSIDLLRSIRFTKQLLFSASFISFFLYEARWFRHEDLNDVSALQPRRLRANASSDPLWSMLSPPSREQQEVLDGKVRYALHFVFIESNFVGMAPSLLPAHMHELSKDERKRRLAWHVSCMLAKCFLTGVFGTILVSVLGNCVAGRGAHTRELYETLDETYKVVRASGMAVPSDGTAVAKTYRTAITAVALGLHYIACTCGVLYCVKTCRLSKMWGAPWELYNFLLTLGCWWAIVQAILLVLFQSTAGKRYDANAFARSFFNMISPMPILQSDPFDTVKDSTMAGLSLCSGSQWVQFLGLLLLIWLGIVHIIYLCSNETRHEMENYYFGIFSVATQTIQADDSLVERMLLDARYCDWSGCVHEFDGDLLCKDAVNCTSRSEVSKQYYMKVFEQTTRAKVRMLALEEMPQVLGAACYTAEEGVVSPFVVAFNVVLPFIRILFALSVRPCLRTMIRQPLVSAIVGAAKDNFFLKEEVLLNRLRECCDSDLEMKSVKLSNTVLAQFATYFKSHPQDKDKMIDALGRAGIHCDEHALLLTTVKLLLPAKENEMEGLIFDDSKKESESAKRVMIRVPYINFDELERRADDQTHAHLYLRSKLFENVAKAVSAITNCGVQNVAVDTAPTIDSFEAIILGGNNKLVHPSQRENLAKALSESLPLTLGFNSASIESHRWSAPSDNPLIKASLYAPITRDDVSAPSTVSNNPEVESALTEHCRQYPEDVEMLIQVSQASQIQIDPKVLREAAAG